jgi:hypothetical protein
MMNKRIKELAEKAGFIPDNAPEMNSVLEKFAQLIVEECLSCCEDERDLSAIKEHFGVE